MLSVAVFQVIVPAKADNGNGEVLSDPHTRYATTVGETPPSATRQIGEALVFGGLEVSGRIHGCTYMTSDYQIPGIGIISFH